MFKLAIVYCAKVQYVETSVFFHTSSEQTEDDRISHVDNPELQFSIAICHMSIRKIGIL